VDYTGLAYRDYTKIYYGMHESGDNGILHSMQWIFDYLRYYDTSTNYVYTNPETPINSDGSINVDGWFGDNTLTALIRFQLTQVSTNWDGLFDSYGVYGGTNVKGSKSYVGKQTNDKLNGVYTYMDNLACGDEVSTWTEMRKYAYNKINDEHFTNPLKFLEISGNTVKQKKDDGRVDSIFHSQDHHLVLHTSPTKPKGRIVQMPNTMPTRATWYAAENLSSFKGNTGEVFRNDSNRYWVAVGPKVLVPNYPDSGKIWAEEFNFNTELDAVLKDKDGKQWYLFCIVGDIKAHTYPNGIYQTGKPYPNNSDQSVGYADSSVIEFIGKIPIGVNQYTIDRLIVYDY
jgi:hypothetical protein